MLRNIRWRRGNFLVRRGQFFVGNELVLRAIDTDAIRPMIRTQRDASFQDWLFAEREK